MPALETAALLKLAFGVSGVLISLYKTGLNDDGVNYDETFNAIFGQTVGGIFYDLTKGGANSTYEKLKANYGKIDLRKDNLNHDLQKAVRKSQLIATFFAAQYCLEELNSENNQLEKSKAENNKIESVEEKGFFSKTAEKAKAAGKKTKNIFVKDSQKKYLKEVIEYLNQEIKGVDKFDLPQSIKFEDIKEILGDYQKSNSDDLQKSVSKTLKADILAELEVVAKLPDYNFDQVAFNFLTKTIEDGWEEFPKEKIVSDKFISLDIYAPKPSPKGKKYDWFNLLCSFFNEEYKMNSRVEAAAQKKLLLDISTHFGRSKTKNSKLVRKISKIARNITAIKKGVEYANLKLDEQKKTLEVIKKYIAPEKEGIPINLVSLPDRKDKIYGRDEEIKDILKFLEDEKEHGAIVTPTCFGKTSLIKKFLFRTTDEIYVKKEYENLFQKVIYLYCYKNQEFEQIIKPFASLMGETLKYTVGEEENFLKLDVFDKLQSEKILFIVDNFESWLDESEEYLNQDIKVFLNTLFNSNHQIRMLFISQNLPHNARSFFTKVNEIKGIDKKLKAGLDKEAALKFVEKEGRKDVFENVSENELIDFFEKVHYVPQAIQSMINFVDEEAVSFDEFQTEFWEAYKKAEADESKIDDNTPQELRPTRALLRRQILKSNDERKYLLSLLAFFESLVPKEVLLNDLSEYDLNELRKALDRLVKNKLVEKETDPEHEFNENTGKKTLIDYYSLHGFIREVIRDVLPEFEKSKPDILQKIADRLRNESDTAWEKKVFEKLIALVVCLEKIEIHYFDVQNRGDREFYLYSARFDKALAFQETAFTSNKKIGIDELKERAKISEILYLEFIGKYPNKANARYNYGILLDNLERYEDAEKQFLEAIRINPDYANARNNYGILLKNLERNEDAEKQYLEAIRINPDYADAHNNYGNLLIKLGRNEEAEKSYNEAIKIKRNYAPAYFNLACLNSLSNNREDCFNYLRKAVEMDSKFKSMAKTDSDFDNVRDAERFKEIVGGDDE